MTPLVADGCSQCPLEIKETTLVFYSDFLNFYIQIFPGRFDTSGSMIPLWVGWVF